MFSLRTRTTNELRLWQDSFSGDVAAREIRPASITLLTRSRSRSGKSYSDDLKLYWDSDENYALKAAVFATAFKAAGYRVDSLSSSSEYEDDD